MFEIISLYTKSATGKVYRSNITTDPEVELLREFAQKLFDELKIKANVVIKGNSIGFNEIKNFKKRLEEFWNSGELYNYFNMSIVNDFENELLREDLTKEKLQELYKKANQFAMSCFLFSDFFYKKIFQIFKKHNKLELFYKSILPEKENFFLRIAKEGLKGNFSKVFGKEKILPQKIEKGYLLNDLSYWSFDFLTEIEKKNIHVLNTLQYLLDEKNFYLSFLRDLLKKESDVYSINKDISLIKLSKKFLLINQNSRFVFVDEFLFNYLKFSSKIHDYKLIKERKNEMDYLYKNNLIMKNGSFYNYNSISQSYSLIKPSLIVLNLTLKCNLRCPYCYNFNNVLNNKLKSYSYDFNLSVLKSAINKLILDLNLPHYTFVFHGGEPLLYFKQILELVDYIENLRKSNHFKVFYSIQTNGILLDSEKIKLLNEKGIHLSISVDGPLMINMKSRGLNKDLAQKLHDNLIYLRNNRIPYSILTTVSKMNYNHINEMLEYFSLIRPSSVRFNTLIMSSAVEDYFLSVEEYTNFYLNLFKEVLNKE